MNFLELEWMGWGKAQRVSDLARIEEANAICILDTRQDEIESPKKISAFSFYLHLKTGKSWTGKSFPTLKGVKVGGAFIMI